MEPPLQIVALPLEAPKRLRARELQHLQKPRIGSERDANSPCARQMDTLQARTGEDFEIFARPPPPARQIGAAGGAPPPNNTDRSQSDRRN